MNKLLVVVDMQKDFVDGALGTPEAQEIVPAVCKRIREFDGTVVFTKDTHGVNYMNTQEGRNLPVPHCVKGTDGWQLNSDVEELSEGCRIIEKPTFGSTELAEYTVENNFDEIELIGLCTDICVISNAFLLKASLPEASISVCASCCAGVTPESHANALEAMKMCQISIV